MKYEVHTVGNDALPVGVHHVIVERRDGPPLLLLNGPVAVCWNMMRAWEDTLEPSCEPSVSVPLRLMSPPAPRTAGWQALARHAV